MRMMKGRDGAFVALLLGLCCVGRISCWFAELYADGYKTRPFILNPQKSNDFRVYWNIPTFMCQKYGINFEGSMDVYDVIQNSGDKFRGDKITILYDPGTFPAMLKNDRDYFVRRNGGVPQEGNLTLHLQTFRQNLKEQIPDPNFSGLGVIDFESWRPIFRQNWASLQIYKDYSIEIEQQRHPFWSKRDVQQEAVRKFEKFGRKFMERTLDEAKKLRPKADWGYYAYPYCFNWTPNQLSPQCPPKIMEENDQLSWLFENSEILYPSVYLQQKLLPNQRVGLVRGRVQEAVRLANKYSKSPKVFAYYSFSYQDDRDTYVNKNDLVKTITEIEKHGANGIILWGSSNSFDSKSKCQSFETYLQQTLGPALQRTRQRFASNF